MKTAIKRFWLTGLVLSATLVWTVGCADLFPHPDPLAGWHLRNSQDPKMLDKAIVSDYQSYIEKLPPKERKLADGACYLVS